MYARVLTRPGINHLVLRVLQIEACTSEWLRYTKPLLLRDDCLAQIQVIAIDWSGLDGDVRTTNIQLATCSTSIMHKW